MNWKSLSHAQLFANPWAVVCQAPLSMEFSRQEYWSGLPFPSPGDLHNSWIKPCYSTLQVDSLPSEPPGKPAHIINLPFFDKWHFKICSRDYQILNPFKISTLHISSIVVLVAADVVFLCIQSSYIFTKLGECEKKNHTKSCYYFFLISLFVSAEIAET